MNLTESSAPDFNIDSFFNYFEEESKGIIQLEREKVFIAQTVDSTNTRLKALLDEAGPLLDADGNLTDDGNRLNKTILASASQTSGYGRLSRSFYSPDQNGIYFSFIYIPQTRSSGQSSVQSFDAAYYTVPCALAVSMAVEKLFDIKPSIKWVNDVYVGDKKVCGILSEGYCPANANSVQALVIGIGINLKTQESDLPEEIKASAGGIFDSTGGKTCSRAKLLAKIIFNCFSFLDSACETWPLVVMGYKARSYLDGKTVRVTPIIGQDKSSYYARVLGITDNAELEVECEDGSIKRLFTGEVTLHQD